MANIVIAITHRSVLLSTKTKKAHIQLVSHNRIRNQPKYNGRFLFFNSLLSSFLSFEKKDIISCIVPIPIISTYTQLMKFIATAIVSGHIQNFLKAPNKLNQNVINECRNQGAHDTTEFHRKTQLFIAKIFGVYIYS